MGLQVINKANMLTDPLQSLYESMLVEQDANDGDYWNALRKSRPDIVDVTTNSENGMQAMGVTISNRKTQSGNLVVRWGTLGDMIFILGIVSPTSKLDRNDRQELKQWIDELCRHILDGKTIATSTNSKSGPLLKRVISKVEQLGGKVSVQKVGQVDIGGEQYVNVMISLE